ncbi:MAG: MoaD/ThiS family protein [Mariprofundales bacterium]
MSVHIMFFGLIAEQQGRRESELIIDGKFTLADLLTSLNIDSELSFILAINQQQISDLSIQVFDDDEVAIMPPFSGG